MHMPKSPGPPTAEKRTLIGGGCYTEPFVDEVVCMAGPGGDTSVFAPLSLRATTYDLAGVVRSELRGEGKSRLQEFVLPGPSGFPKGGCNDGRDDANSTPSLSLDL